MWDFIERKQKRVKKWSTDGDGEQNIRDAVCESCTKSAVVRKGNRCTSNSSMLSLPEKALLVKLYYQKEWRIC